MLSSNRKDVVVAIHQPNFFPWLGFFNKIFRSDIFIIMDNVQFPRTGGTWVNRVKIIINGKADWITVPVDRNFHGTKLINEMKICNAVFWRPKILKTIYHSYKHATYFNQVFPVLEELINNPTDSLVEFNLKSIKYLCSCLNIDTSKIVLGATLNCEGKATDLLISMVKAVNGTAYLCGAGASGYQEDEKFFNAGIKLIYQNFKHPVYPQFNSNEFISGLSIIDVLMNCGFEGTKHIISI